MNKFKSTGNEQSLLYVSAVNVLLIATLTNGQYRNAKVFSVVDDKIFFYIGILCVIMSVLQLFIFRIITESQKKNAEYDMLKQKIGIMEEMNAINRMQRHDFRNHLSVIKGLVDIKKIDRLKEYLNEVIQEDYALSCDLDTGIKEFDILLESKSIKAYNNGIIFNISNNIELDSTVIKPLDIVKIASNIIDNSMDVLNEVTKQDKKIDVAMKEDSINYIVSISNNGDKIPEDQLDKIFERGFSTKQAKDEIRGMGLFIVNRMVKKYNGVIRVESDDNETKFEITIPKVKI